MVLSFNVFDIVVLLDDDDEDGSIIEDVSGDVSKRFFGIKFDPL